MRFQPVLRYFCLVLLVLALVGCPPHWPSTYHSNSGFVDIPDPGTAQAVINVNRPFIVRDVNVTINALHPNLGNCDAWLTSPSGTPIPLFFLISGAHLMDTTFDDEASATIDTGTAPYTGSWQIDSNLVGAHLSVFDGQNALGTWTLHFRDQVAGDAGTLGDWSLTFNTPD